MNRYPSTLIRKETSGPRYFGSMQGDRLDNLAAQFYGDPTLYWILQQANSLNRDSLYPPIGVQIRIPQNLARILDEFNALNS